MAKNINKSIFISGGTTSFSNISTGDHGSANFTNYTHGESDINFDALTNELKTLRLKLMEISDASPESSIMIAKVADAEIASKEKDGNKVMKHLKEVGTWVFETARDIGVDIVTDLIKKQI